MDSPTVEGALLNEGKTKCIYATQAAAGEGSGEALVIVRSKDDLTAGDGKRHDVVAGKASIANQTTVNLFSLLAKSDLPLAFISGRDETSFLAYQTKMLPYEVVVRREAHGSHCRRFPHLPQGTRFSTLLVQFYLKTSNRQWAGQPLPCDDPLIQLEADDSTQPGRMSLYLPSEPASSARAFTTLSLLNPLTVLEEMAAIAARAFLVLEKAWQTHQVRLADYKVEFGYTSSGRLVLSDVIDADSGRLVENGQYLDKQVYRDGGTVEQVYHNYLRIRDLTGQFVQPKDTLVLWRASERDDLTPFRDALSGIEGPHLEVLEICCSAHKQTARALSILNEISGRAPRAVIIAFVGRSNGLGPVLAGNGHLPVLCVPASCQQFPEDAWSSLRMPSDVPCATLLDPKNSVLLALQILAQYNPCLYMKTVSSRPGYYAIA